MRDWLLAATCGVMLLSGAARAQRAMPPADLLTDLEDDGSLVAGLVSDDPHARLVAAQALARVLQPAEASEVLLARARFEPDEDVLVALIFALAQRHHAPAGEWLSDLLGLEKGHPSPVVRSAACDALGRLGDDSATGLLVLRLGDNDASVRGAAALGLFLLDGRRYTHERHAPDAQLARRDAALTEVALHDGDATARWRATYALAGVRGRRGIATVLTLAVRDREPLVRVFAVRGLASLQGEQLGTPFDLQPLFSDPDERVVLEAVRVATVLAKAPEAVPVLANLLATHDSGLVRTSCAEALGELLAGPALDPAVHRSASEALAQAGRADASPMVRRAAASAAVMTGDEGRALFFLHALARGTDRRDRERAATLLEDSPWHEPETLLALRSDPEPAVASAALGTLLAKDAAARPLYDVDREVLVDSLLSALSADDPALRVAGAEAIQADAQAGTLDPRLLHACALSLLSATGTEMKEAAQVLRRDLGLPPDTTPPVLARSEGRLLDRLLARDEAARADPHPRVRLLTTRGEVQLELDRVTAPVHVAAFLELAEKGCYDGLDVHRVVPNFVVQGLDPRGDGYGTGGRRLPDEFSREPYVAGALGMPNAGEPNTGGCQAFITHVPTPHLEGHYTLFGHVVAGMDVVQRLEIGDRVTSVVRG